MDYASNNVNKMGKFIKHKKYVIYYYVFLTIIL